MDPILDEAPCGYVVFNDEGIITNANRTIADLLGYLPGEMTGRKMEELLTIAGRIFYQTHFFPLLRLHEKAEEIFLTLVGKEKTEVPVLVNAARRATTGQMENHCVMVPVHQRRKYEDELLQAKRTAEEALQKNEMLGRATEELEASKVELDRQVTKLKWMNEDLVEFSHVISHDIQEPIRKIAMFADMIDRENHHQLTELSKLSVEKINGASRKMRDLIGCLQQYVSVDSTIHPPVKCDLEAIAMDASMRAIMDAKYDDVNLRMRDLPIVEGHMRQLDMLFYNLVSNSIQFRKEEEPLEIDIEADIIQENSYKTTEGKYKYVDYARIVYKDNGTGFSNDYKDYVFQLFKKVHINAKGMGFGLALCKKIVKNHFGSITVKSAKGEGVVFTIMLPAGNREKKHTKTPEKTALETRN